MTAFTDEVREACESRAVIGGRRAAAMLLASDWSGQDEETGSVDENGYWVARFGRSLLYVDDRGFISSETHKTEASAIAHFQEIEDEFMRDADDEVIPAGYVSEEMPDDTGFDFDSAYRVVGYAGVAWRAVGYEKFTPPSFEWTGIRYEDRTTLGMVMVGDDRIFWVDRDDVVAIGEDDYCPSCGQIGCGWH